MKTIKKVIFPVLMLVFILSFTACNGLDKKIVGKWATTVDITDELGLDEEFADFNSKLELKMVFEFTSDGAYKISFDKENTETVMKKWADDFIEFLKGMSAKQAEDMGMSYEEFKEAYKQQSGSEFEADLEKQIETMDMNSLLEESESAGKYKVIGNNLFMTAAGEEESELLYDTFEISGDTLKLLGKNDPEYVEENSFIKYPMEFTRVK